MSLRQAHDVADRIETELEKAHPEIVDVVVHLEPEGHEGAPSPTP
jgi:divalent metal cation (Fe/Co/Zn/Cd) transporter